MTRIAKMYFDQSGHIAEPSAFHGFHYYNLGLANDGFMYIEGLVHLSQTLFAMAKTYDDAGGAPVVTQIDGGGAMNSKTADKFYAARNTKKVVTVHHWQHGKCERKHMIKSMARAMMSAAGAPTSFWYLAVRHAVLISNVILPARDEHGKTIGGTVWEAHYGVKPRVQDLLLGPWGCLAYLIMTEEQRQKQHKKRGETKHWGVRAISGIYVGSYCDPQTLVFKHLMTDGRSIMLPLVRSRWWATCIHYGCRLLAIWHYVGVLKIEKPATTIIRRSPSLFRSIGPSAPIYRKITCMTNSTVDIGSLTVGILPRTRKRMTTISTAMLSPRL